MYIFKLIAESETMNLTSNNLFDLVEISGLTEFKRTIYSSSSGALPGEMINGSHIEPRNISIKIKPKYVDSTSVDICSSEVISFLSKSNTISLQWIKSNSFSMTINGTVESISDPRFDKDSMIYIDMVCPYPFFISDELKGGQLLEGETEYYERTIVNNGNSSVGCIIDFWVYSDVVSQFIIENTTTGEILSVSNIVKETSSSRDKIEICTIPGKEYIINIDSGSDLFSSFDPTSEWINVKSGSNDIRAKYIIDGGEYSGTYPRISFNEVFI